MRIGVDLGGTKIEAIALDRDGRERGRRRVPTPRDRYAATLAAITTLVEGLERESGEPARVGIGMPGALSPATGLVKNANSVWLNGRPLRQDLERLLHRPLRFANDANCFALSEARDGAGAGARGRSSASSWAPGTGGGIVVDGRVLDGPERGRRRVGPQSPPLAARRASGRARPATAGGRAAWRPSSRGPESPGTTARRPARSSTRRRSPRGPPAATRAARRRSPGTRSGSRGRWPRWSISSTRTSSCSAAACRTSTRLYERVPERWGAWVFSDRVDTAAPSPHARRLQRRPRGRVALGGRRGRREAEPVAAAYRLSAVRRLANALVRATRSGWAWGRRAPTS